MVDAAEWHEQLRYLSETVAIVDDFRNWGYTIYRTAYGPSTDQRWQQLLEKIQTQAYAATLRVCKTTADDPTVQQVWSLFRLDARSDPALKGLSMEQLRLLYRNGDGGVPMNADLRSHRVFLLADEEVLSDADAFLVKCVEADYEAADHVPRNTRLGGQRYFGWMPMRSAEIVELWKELEFNDLERIAPRTIAGSHLKIWENVAW
tara:strand:- start:478 stop:1092 length:615 start_codon:yes stop_codon:yes gene_type:complete